MQRSQSNHSAAAKAAIAVDRCAIGQWRGVAGRNRWAYTVKTQNASFDN